MLPTLIYALRLIADLLEDQPQQMTPTAGAPGSHRARLHDAVDKVAALVSRGMPDLDACLRVAPIAGLDLGELLDAWKLHAKQRAARDLHAKRLLVQFLTEQRWKDADIARVLGVHVKHVPRMRRALREQYEEARQREWARGISAPDGPSNTIDGKDTG